MSARRTTRLVTAAALLLLPALARAEVSVQVRRDGTVKRVLYLTRQSGLRPIVWGQVRPYLSQDLILNPLGDNRGDLAPFITRHPVTGNPWVVWSVNDANQKRIAVSQWNGKVWTAPLLVVPQPGAMREDQLDPVLTFDASGAPLLVWWQAGQTAKVYFSTIVRDKWTPPLLLSNPGIDSRRPTLELGRTDLAVTWTTPSGKVTRTQATGVLVESATSLMDSPIPPGNAPPPPGGNPGGDGDQPFTKRK